MSDVEGFLRRYRAAWPSFDPELVPAVVHPEASIHHSGMEEQIRGDEEADYVRAIKALMPDARLRIANWAARGDIVFVEYEVTATVAGRPLAWTGIGRFRLRGDRVIDAIGRWDNLDLLAQLDGTTRRTAFAETAAALVASRRGD
jgi:hypothetical protein